MNVFVLFVLAALAAEPPPGGWPDPPESGRVKTAYDGDTLTLTDGEKIRLKWVNTPELKPAEEYGIQARDATRRFVSGEEVKLTTSADARDGYGRIVAGVSTSQGDLSLHLVEQGLAHVFIIPPDDLDPTALLEAQAKARKARRGIWSTDRYQGVLHITSFHANAPGDDRQNVNGEYLRISNISDGPVNLAGFRITKSTGQSWELPTVVVPAGHTFELHSGKGEHKTDPGQQIEVFLGSEFPIWNNSRDKATLYDSYGREQDSRVHEVKD